MIALPLAKATRKNEPDVVVWTKDRMEASEKLKNVLTSESVLASPDTTRPFILQSNPSVVGIGAVLSQVDDTGVERPVAYYSRKLKPRETRYTVTEQECLAVVQGIKHYSVYLEGTHFTVVTDHSSLHYLDRLHDEKGSLAWWALTLQPYSFTVVHRLGSSNSNTDGLSCQAWATEKQQLDNGAAIISEEETTGSSSERKGEMSQSGPDDIKKQVQTLRVCVCMLFICAVVYFSCSVMHLFLIKLSWDSQL